MKAAHAIVTVLFALTFAVGGWIPVASAQQIQETQATAPSPETKPAAKKTALEMKVVGVLAIGDGEDRRSSAIIAMKGSKTSKTYSPGQAIDDNPDVKLVKVCNERIEFLNQGRLEYATVRQFPEAGWGGNSPVPTSSSSASSNSASTRPEGASDRLQALRDARSTRQQKRNAAGANRSGAQESEIIPPTPSGPDAEAQP